MSPSDTLFPTYRQMLTTLSGLLDKASAQLGSDQADALMSARLAPDMYPLATQVRYAAYQAQEATFRLRGEPVPASVTAIADEARAGGERPGTLADAKGRVDQALSFLNSLDPADLNRPDTQQIALALPNGAIFDMTPEQFVRDWALPQLYFHVVTAYAILRNNGVEIGKADYVPHMFAYLRSA